MQTHLLSDNERKMLTEYMRTGKGSDVFRVLKFRILRNYSTIKEDYELLTKAKDSFRT